MTGWNGVQAQFMQVSDSKEIEDMHTLPAMVRKGTDQLTSQQANTILAMIRAASILESDQRPVCQKKNDAPGDT